jgi:hypothetical protein
MSSEPCPTQDQLRSLRSLMAAAFGEQSAPAVEVCVLVSLWSAKCNAGTSGCGSMHTRIVCVTANQSFRRFCNHKSGSCAWARSILTSCITVYRLVCAHERACRCMMVTRLKRSVQASESGCSCSSQTQTCCIAGVLVVYSIHICR